MPMRSFRSVYSKSRLHSSRPSSVPPFSRNVPPYVQALAGAQANIDALAIFSAEAQIL